MRFSYLGLTALLACLQLVDTTHAYACSCTGERPTSDRWERAKVRAQGASLIFEGVPTRFEMRWDALSAKDGELISADEPSPHADTWWRMLVTFQVTRSYKGDVGPQIQLRTGLGGGDCGARFAVGVPYLVYADELDSGRFFVSLCSPGAWVGDSELGADLRYLRKERPVPADHLPIKSWTKENEPEIEAERVRHLEEYAKAFASAAGKICGTVRSREKIEKYAFMVSFLSAAGYSPVEHPRAQVKEDGSFCSEPLGPGKYDIFLTKGFARNSPLGVYYPGVPDRKQARQVEVAAGQTVSGITLEVPKQKTYSVRGFISVPYKASPSRVQLMLARSDGAPFDVWRSETIDLESWPAIRGVKYFSIDNVLPGRYVPILSVDPLNAGWFTPKQEVVVANHSKFLALQLVHK